MKYTYIPKLFMQTMKSTIITEKQSVLENRGIPAFLGRLITILRNSTSVIPSRRLRVMLFTAWQPRATSVAIPRLRRNLWSRQGECSSSRRSARWRFAGCIYQTVIAGLRFRPRGESSGTRAATTPLNDVIARATCLSRSLSFQRERNDIVKKMIFLYS